MAEVETTPMDEIPGVEEYMVAENLTDGHNKVYILCHVKSPVGERLVRFWGRHDAGLQTTDEVWSEDVFSNLVATKLSKKKGYDILEPEQMSGIAADRYKGYRRQIVAYFQRKGYTK